MKISSERLNEVVQNFLRATKRANIQTTADLTANLGQRLDVRGGEYIEFLRSPSNRGTTALTASYVAEGDGIPIEVKCNLDLGYSKVVVKTEGKVPGYTVFAVDPFGNQAQSASYGTDEFADILKRLEEQFRIDS